MTQKKTLIIAEKPSVARDIARVLKATTHQSGCISGSHHTISWCVGHLVELAPPPDYQEAWSRWRLEDLPMLPDPFKLVPKSQTLDHFELLRALLLDPQYDQVVNACDAGREGELIFGYVYELTGCTLPVKRLWIASLTDESIEEGLASLQEGEAFASLYQSAKARSEADWLVGLNATRLLTLLSRETQPSAMVPTLSVGRVQTPTLALVVARDRARARFTSTTSYSVEADFCTPQGHTYSGRAVSSALEALLYGTHAEALALNASLNAAPHAHIVRCESKTSSRTPPQFFDLTSLQRDANVRLGFSAQHTLDLAQALYERHKLLTYPRTDSRHITPDLARTLIGRLKTLHTDVELGALALTLVVDVAGLSKRMVNAEKVSDHHAILPTTESSTHKSLSDDERALYTLVCRRMLAALSQPAEVASTTLVTTWGDCLFLTRGTQVLVQGWMDFERPQKEDRDEDVQLPTALTPGELVTVTRAATYTSTTRAPAALTEASLLFAMETAGKSLENEALSEALSSTGGLGTPATRASMIETLIKRGYLERQKKSVLATTLGHSLISALEAFPSLTSAEMTGNWEVALEAIVSGKLSEGQFMGRARQLVQAICDHFKASPPTLELPKRDTLGACPSCGQEVCLGDKSAWCANAQCSFVLFRHIAGKTLSPTQLSHLLVKRKTSVLKGFKSRKGDSFAAALQLEEGTWKVTFSFDDAPQSKEAMS